VILAIPTLLVLLAFTNGNPAVPVYAASSVTSDAAPIALGPSSVNIGDPLLEIIRLQIGGPV
jgi:hypothetical protein